jgi:hypothetical protein
VCGQKKTGVREPLINCFYWACIPSGAKAHDYFAGFMYGLKPVPFKISLFCGIYVRAKARTLQNFIILLDLCTAKARTLQNFVILLDLCTG